MRTAILATFWILTLGAAAAVVWSSHACHARIARSHGVHADLDKLTALLADGRATPRDAGLFGASRNRYAVELCADTGKVLSHSEQSHPEVIHEEVWGGRMKSKALLRAHSGGGTLYFKTYVVDSGSRSSSSRGARRRIQAHVRASNRGGSGGEGKSLFVAYALQSI